MKKYIITAILFGLILVSAIWILTRTSSESNNPQETPIPTVVLPTISDSTKVSLTAKNGNKAVILKISGIENNIDSIEYELTYQTESGLPRGVLGKIIVDGESEITRDDIVLGTCSSGKCVYDTGVTSIDLSLKFVSIDGNASVYRNTFNLAQ